MQIAEAWYNHPAWGFIGTVVGVIAIVAGIWAAFRAAVPRMRLRYSMSGATRLIAMQIGLTVTRDGQELKDPWVATVMLAADGRQDIPEDAFSKARPLVMELGVPIVALLETRYTPADAPVPAVTTEGTTLQIGPDLLHRDSILTMAVLLDGGRPELRPPSRVLVDVQLKQGSPREQGDPWWVTSVGGIFAGALLALWFFLTNDGLAGESGVTILALIVGLGGMVLSRINGALRQKRQSQDLLRGRSRG